MATAHGYREYGVASIAELLSALEKVYRSNELVWFRGHADQTWHLEPSLSRSGKLQNEIQLAKRFQQNAWQFLDHVPEKEWEWMFLMQHYAVPTRLLDWSESLLIALYFALQDASIGSKLAQATVWCLYPNKLNAISKVVLTPPEDIPSFGAEEGLLDDYLPSRVHGATVVSKNPLAIVAPRRFQRVYAQQGVFTIMHRERCRLEDLHDEKGRQDHLVKLRIPKKGVTRMRKELLRLRVNKLAVFPQLENVAEAAKDGIL